MFAHDSFVDFGLDYSVIEDGGIPQGAFFGADWSNAGTPGRRSSICFWVAATSFIVVGLLLIRLAVRRKQGRMIRVLLLLNALAIPVGAQENATDTSVTNALRARESRIVSGFFDWKETRLVVAGSRLAFCIERRSFSRRGYFV